MADINALYASLLAADEARDAAALAAVAWQMYGQLATTAADLGALRARFRIYAAAPHTAPLPAASLGPGLPCTDDPELFFAESPDDVETAKALCRECPARAACLAGALKRREPWGVWGGELFLRGAIVPRKRPRGRPRKTDVAA
jgi:WhiB family transcriptional regulator, redox-sensing transcriptional regulator